MASMSVRLAMVWLISRASSRICSGSSEMDRPVHSSAKTRISAGLAPASLRNLSMRSNKSWRSLLTSSDWFFAV
uniref:Putative secreted protein n=1 Tax=Ixodes ricinus TaxID=34613 RepID=A0A6B0UAJ3_IXORI